jgi:hypothetical protein
LKRSRGYRLLNPLFSAGPIVVALTAGFAPNDVLDRSAVLAGFTQQMLAWFPFLGGHAVRSSYPQVVTLVKSLSFAFLPLSIAGGFVALWGIRDWTLQRIRRGFAAPFPWWLPMVGVALFLVGFFSNWWLTNEPSFCQGCTTRNRVGLAFFEAGIVFGLGFIPALVAVAIFVRRALRQAK